ncbi:MAG: CotH kinase family protein [Deltaproteobacteria bacterium]|nr:CotH kinase family protein [Deltaproteobacteria bacterium]
MRNDLFWLMMLLFATVWSSCQRSDSENGGTDTASSGTDTDSVTDDTSGTPWVYGGPRQQAIGSIALVCDETALTSSDCAVGAPTPCVPKAGKILCTAVVNDGAGVNEYTGVVGIEQWGRGSGVYPKTNYELELRLADGITENPVPILGMGKEEDWILDGSWTDRSFMRTDIVFDIFKELGGDTHVAADSRYVTLTFNGQPRGVYRVSERVKRDDDRVDIPADDGNVGTNFIVKLDNDGLITDVSVGANVANWQPIYPSEGKISGSQQSGIAVWLANLSAAMSAGTPFERLNMSNVVDWVLMNEFAKNLRTFDRGWYLFKSGENKANLIPADADMSFGQPDVSAEGWVPHNQMTTYLLSDSAFRSALVTRWAQLRAGPLADAALTQRIDDYQLALPVAAINANFALWPIDQLDLCLEDDLYTTPEVADYAAEVAALRQWITSRLAWMDANIAAYQ